MYNPGLLVLDITPAHNETNVPINTGVSVKFTYDMIEETITSSTLLFSRVNGSSLAASVTYNRTTRTALVKPTAPLEVGVQYRLTIVGGDNGISTITDSKLPENKIYEFSTTNSIAVSSPSFLSVTSSNGYSVLEWLAPDVYNVDKELKYLVKINVAGGENPDGSPTSVLWPTSVDILEIAGNTLNLPIKLTNGNYYAFLQAINGETSSEWIKYQFLIETVPVSAPTISGGVFEVNATYPKSDEVNVTPDSIKILFTDDLDMTTVTTSSVYIIKGPKPKTLNAIDLMTKFAPNKSIAFTIDALTMGNLISLTVDPSTIEDNTEYTVIVRETVKDLSQGSSLGEVYAWSFLSTMSPLFGDAQRIRDDIDKFIRNLSDKVLYKYMHDTSLIALDVVSRTISPFIEETFLKSVPRYVHEYVRFQTGYDLLVNAIMQEANGIGSSRTLGDLSIQPNQNMAQVNQLLVNMKSRIKHWEDQLHGHHNRGYAKPTTAVKGEIGASYPDFLTRTELTDPSEG